MRLKANKTWSQQQLVVKLIDRRQNRRGLLNWERQRLLIHAAKTAVAAGLCYWMAHILGLPDGYWAAISAIIVLQSNFGATMTASRDRLIGTLIGAVLGFSFSFLGVLPWNFMAAVLLAVILCGVLGLRSSSRLAGVTISVVMLVEAGGSHTLLALHRVMEVVVGIVVALLIATLVFPDRARLRLKDGLAQEFLVLSAFFEAILHGFGGAPAENLITAHDDALKIMGANKDLLEASRQEPSGGPGWREGLGTLSHFGRSIFDALVALEFSVRDSHKDGYAQQLEPDLGKLVADIAFGFHHVAGSIHRWQFHIPPHGIVLENDIARLEEKLNTVRPKGIEFSQEEILRAYSVLLHLKQLARLLRASRVETSEAVGENEGLE